MKLKDLGEFNLINKIAKRIRTSGRVIKGIGDDASVLRYKKHRFLLFASDMLVEGKHFHKTTHPYLIGKKSLSVNISDIASMGGVPHFMVISLGVPPYKEVRYVDGIYKGIMSVAKKFNVDIVGGDTVSSDKLIIDIALLGEVEKKSLVLRSGAKEGDSVFVTGSIGGASKKRHLAFTPRLKEARFLVKNFRIHSMIDVSDGLLADLGHILESSKVGSVIYERDIPLSSDAASFDSAVREGEDFELIFTISKRDAGRLLKTWPFKSKVSKIGEISRKHKGLFLVRKNGTKEKLKPEGYVHF